jgi:hypothetical protein
LILFLAEEENNSRTQHGIMVATDVSMGSPLWVPNRQKRSVAAMPKIRRCFREKSKQICWAFWKLQGKMVICHNQALIMPNP